VKPEGVMKALAHWMEEEGITEKTPSTIFDEEFAEQIYAHGRIEDSKVMKNFFKKTGQPLIQGWLIEFTKRMMKGLPIAHGLRMGLNVVFTPKTKSWGKTGEVLQAYVREQKEAAHG
jgi:heterodisulfide reductase subunit C